MRVSESEANDEDNFFFGGDKPGELADFEPESYAYVTDKAPLSEPEPLVGATLNLFKLSGRNIPTETDKYESSVY